MKLKPVQNAFIFALPLIIQILIISGCNNIKENVSESDISNSGLSNLGASCTAYSECKLPMEFMIQSNCPFTTACINSKCKVICPLVYHDPNPEISKSYPFTCNTNSECNCEERGEKTIDCVCVDNKCVSVEAG